MGANQAHCTVAEDTVWLAVGAEFKPAAFRLWSIRGDTGDLKGTGIRNKAVPHNSGSGRPGGRDRLCQDPAGRAYPHHLGK